MNKEDDTADLISKAAKQHGVSPELLRKLLALESKFTNFEVWGAKTDFARQVAKILEEAMGQEDL